MDRRNDKISSFHIEKQDKRINTLASLRKLISSQNKKNKQLLFLASNEYEISPLAPFYRFASSSFLFFFPFHRVDIFQTGIRALLFERAANYPRQPPLHPSSAGPRSPRFFSPCSEEEAVVLWEKGGG